MDNDGVAPPKGSTDLAPSIHGVDFAACGLTTIIVFLRTYTRIWITKDFGADDYTTILAMLCVWLGKTLVTFQTVYALGRHKAQVQTTTYQRYLFFDWMDWIQTICVLAIAKIAICLFLLRLTHFHQLKYWIWGLIVFTVVSHVPFIVLLTVRCKPIKKYWKEDVPGTCASKKQSEIVIIMQGVCSIIIDIICAATPIVLLHNAKIKRKIKIQLCLLMGAGFLTAIACCIRTGFSYQVMSDDLSWVSVPNSMSRMFEVNMGVWAACAPMMKPFTRYMRAKYTPRQVRIRDTSIPSISFWHRSWWRTNSRSHSNSQPRGPIITKREVESASTEKLRVASRNRIKQKDFRIPSMSLGTDFQSGLGRSSKLDEETIVELNGTLMDTKTRDAELVGKSWFQSGDEP